MYLGGIIILNNFKSYLIIILLLAILLLIPYSPLMTQYTAWKNGPTGSEFSTDPATPKYGTQDWIAEHALDMLNDNEKQYLLKNLATYLYGTELPDKTTGADAINDPELQHIYFNTTGSLMDDSAAIRTVEERDLAIDFIENGDIYNGTLHLGIMTHYLAALAAFGNVMNETYWGIPVNHTNYIDYVNSKMASYTSEFDSYLSPSTSIIANNPYDAAVLVAYDTTFDTKGTKTCTWMDNNYGWSNGLFKDRCGASLNFAVNAIADVLHFIYKDNFTSPSSPQNLEVDDITGHVVNLSWSANTDKNLEGYSIYINETGSSNKFEPIPIANVTSETSYSVTNLRNETTYYFKIRAYSIVGKESSDSNIVSATTLDITPPLTPIIFDLTEMTNNPKITVSGRSFEPNTRIEVFLNNNFSEPAGVNYSSESAFSIFWVAITLVEGENNITARAVDASGNPSELSQYQIVLLDTIAPNANAGANVLLYKRESPVLVTFDGSNSTDNLGIISNYTWTLDLKFKLVTLYGLSSTYIFETAGDFLIILNITDPIGNWATDIVWVNISQLDYQPPYIITYDPKKDSVNQSVNVTIKAIFNEPLNVSSIKIRLIDNIEGELQLPRPSYDPLTRLLSLKPFANLTHDRIYTVIINATDLVGNALINGIWTFTTVARPFDFDGDQIPDIWEWKYGLDANKSDSFDDPDSDLLSNLDEYNKGKNSTDPTNPDTDGDGMIDYFEFIYSLNPLDPTDRDGDPDKDGKTNYEEYLGEDGMVGNFDWTDPNTSDISSKEDEGDEDDYTWVIIIMVIIILIIIILVLMLRKIKYKQTNELIKDDDGYLKTKDATELGVGGNIFFEGPDQYYMNNKPVKERYEGDAEVSRSLRADKKVQGDKGTTRPTPAEILERAKREEKKCPKCGAGLPKDTTYCFECGTMLDEKSK